MTKALVYVATDRWIPLSQGQFCVAMLPATAQRKYSLLLSAAGKVVRVDGTRIQGVGPARFAQEQYGFVPAGEKDEGVAQKLRAAAYAIEGLSLVEQGLQEMAAYIQTEHAGKKARYIPFEADKPSGDVQIGSDSGIRSRVFGLATGVCSANVDLADAGEIGSTVGSGADLARGWLVVWRSDDPQASAPAMPQITEYGEMIEHAAYVLCNAGLATLFDTHLLVSEYTEDPDFVRGKMRLGLTRAAEDSLELGVDAMDNLIVRYRRNGQVIHRIEGLIGDRLRLGAYLSTMAAAICAVEHADASAAPGKKAS